MHLRDLECFLAVADELHFGRAAQRLYVSQAMVSQAVQRLERELGGSLFDRTSRSVRLTAMGAEFEGLARAGVEAVVTAYRTGQRLAREGPEVFVLAYARPTAGDLIELVRQERTLAVELRNMPTPAQLLALRQRRVHAGLGWETPAAEDLELEVVTRTPLAVVVRDDHPLAVRDELRLADVAAHHVVGWPRGLAPELTAVVAQAVDPSGGWSFALTATMIDDIAAHVLAGRGVGVLPQSLLGAFALTGLTVRPLVDGPIVREVLAWRAGEAHPLLSTIREALGSAPFGRADLP